jgi:hypothetical protein
VHDGSIEERLRSVLRAEGDALPLTITADELERRLALRRREQRNRRFGLVAAAVAVVAIGSLVAVNGAWLPTSDVGATAMPTTSGPIRTPEATTASPEGLPCAIIEPNAADQPPTIVLGATPGDSIAWGGALGAYRLGDRVSGEPGDFGSINATNLDRVPAVPPTERLVVLAGSPLASTPDPCLTGLVADAVPIDAIGAPVLPLADLTIAPTRTIEFDKPPSGEWLVRVQAQFATTNGAPAWVETFFRVDARNPASSLGPVLGNLPVLNTPPGTIFLDEHSDQLEPAETTGRTDRWVVGDVEPRPMYLVYAVCLGSSPLRWSIGREGQFDFLAAGDLACDGQQVQEWVERGMPTGNLAVVLEGDPATAWRIVVATVADAPSFIPPAIRMIETGNTEGSAGAAQAFGRCVSHDGAADQCAGEWFVLEGARGILLPSNSRLTFGLEDGWTIDQARITAAVTDEVRARSFAPEYSVGFVDQGGPLITIPVDLGRGSWIVRVALNASKDGDTFGAHYDLPLVIE